MVWHFARLQTDSNKPNILIEGFNLFFNLNIHNTAAIPAAFYNVLSK